MYKDGDKYMKKRSRWR